MSGLRKLLILILITVFSLSVISCKETAEDRPDLNINTPEIEYDTNPRETIGDWQMDSTGNFSYLKLNPRGRFDMFFDEGMVFHENMFIYEVYDSSSEPVKLYGYMDTSFNKLTDPISLEPNIFMYGVTRVVTEDGSYIINRDFQSVEEFYPGYVLVNNVLMEVDWGKKFYQEPFMVSDSDLTDYIVPYKVNPGPGNNLSSPVFGYKTIQDAYFNDTPAEEEFIIPAVYQDAKLFCDGIAAVKSNDNWGFIDRDGNIVADFKYADAVNLTHGIAALYQELGYNDMVFGSWMLIDTLGNELIPDTTFSMPEVFQPNRFIDNLAFIGSENYKLLNSNGEILTGWLGYMDEGPPLFYEDYIVINQSGQKYFYGKNGAAAFPTRYSDARNFSDGLAAVYNNQNKKWGYINTSGERVIPYAYSRTTDFSQGYAYVSIDTDNISITLEPGFLIDQYQNEYLKELNLVGMTKFNEDGYALAYSIEINDYWVNINAGRPKHIQAEYVLETRDDKVYYMIRIEQP